MHPDLVTMHPTEAESGCVSLRWRFYGLLETHPKACILPGSFCRKPPSSYRHLTAVISRKRRAIMNAAATRTMEELLSSRQELNRASAEFLRIDLETGLTFAGIARQTQNDSRKSRNRLAARKAYETIMRLVKKVDLTVEDGVSMKRGLDQLKKELEGLGERF